jgi:hypothetical protein
MQKHLSMKLVVYLTFRQKKKFNIWLSGTAITLIGIYFAIYDIISVWDPIYRAYLPLTDFWMITLLVLGCQHNVEGVPVAQSFFGATCNNHEGRL